MKKFNLIYIAAFSVFIILLISLNVKIDNSVTFYGFAENKETEISMENSVEVKNINVTTGQKVKKGTVLLDVLSSSLPIKISNTEYSIEELQTKYSLWKTDLDWRISQYNIELNEKTSKIQSQIDQYNAEIDQNKKLAESIQSIENVTSDEGNIKNPIFLKIDALKEELNFTRNIITTEINNLKSERFASNNPLLSQIKSLEGELEYFQEKKEKQIITAPTDGLIGNVHCKEGEKIPSFATLITFYEESPTLVIGYIHEDLILRININDTIDIFSSSRPDIQNTGVVKTLGSRIVEIPPRLRKIKELKTFGREIIIEIPPDNPFLQKEKVILNLKD
ncbi:MAG: multidrug resistance efflux pump [Flavobacteriaceae bacterium]|jgi:multidrug resistance efflux pump|uniref:HlyD family secretion protein n=1 Tax=Candidatus Marifrigoribacter sp. Uisw_064 TaxID=3230970 RepID=UPI003AEA36FC